MDPDRPARAARARPRGACSETIGANDNRHPAGRLEHGVLTLALEIRAGLLQPEEDGGPGIPALAFAEAGGPLQAPGPLIRVPQGTEIRVSLRNRADSTIVVHGLASPSTASDSGVLLNPGETREVRFRATAAGTYYYWGGFKGRTINDRRWLDSQLAGALVVDPPGAVPDDRIFVIGLWQFAAEDSAGVPRPVTEHMVINGKSWPYTERLTYPRGSTVRWRVLNPTVSSHPMHLHGFFFHVDSRGDGRSQQNFRGRRATPRGDRPDVPGRDAGVDLGARAGKGNWVFHCHFPFHVSHHLALPRDSAAMTGAPRVTAVSTGATRRGRRPRIGAPDERPGAWHPRRARRDTRGPAGRARSRRATSGWWRKTAPHRYGTLAGMGYVVQEGG